WRASLSRTRSFCVNCESSGFSNAAPPGRPARALSKSLPAPAPPGLRRRRGMRFTGSTHRPPAPFRDSADPPATAASRFAVSDSPSSPSPSERSGKSDTTEAAAGFIPAAVFFPPHPSGWSSIRELAINRLELRGAAQEGLQQGRIELTGGIF